VLDVGCGPGAFTAELVGAAGEAAVSAVDPSPSFVDAAGSRYPGVDVRLASAEDLPYRVDEFDAARAQLVVHFMTDPVAGLAEMARVTRSGGRVAACVWDHAGDRSPISAFWQAVRELGLGHQDESDLPGARRGLSRSWSARLVCTISRKPSSSSVSGRVRSCQVSRCSQASSPITPIRSVDRTMSVNMNATRDPLGTLLTVRA
jgi:SAM-dependent methyltransferase